MNSFYPFFIDFIRNHDLRCKQNNYWFWLSYNRNFLTDLSFIYRKPTIFLILSKPIKRSDFIIGKFLWFSIVVFLILFFEAILFLGMLFFREIEISNLVIWSLINTFLKLEIVLALVFFFSSFMWSFMTIIVTVLIYLLWHSYSLVLNLAYKWENTFIIYLSKWIWILFPQFEALNTKDLIWNFTNLSNTLLFTNLSVSLLYIAVLIILTNLIFSKKTFE